MSKSRVNSAFERILTQSQSRSSRSNRFVRPQSMLHTTEIIDGWGRRNVQSATEESSFREFLARAKLAEFQAEKRNFKFVIPKANVEFLSAQEKVEAKEKYEKFWKLVGIPRRPELDDSIAPEQRDKLEREEFHKWQLYLSQWQENLGFLLTPFERNLECWRQLWRVVERSDVIVQIVDARNPLLFRCEDLEKYVKEVSPEKENVILINKSDFLTASQRKRWANYFDSCGMRALFFSAVSIQEEMPTLEESTQSAIGELDMVLTNLSINSSVPMFETEFEEMANKYKTFVETMEKHQGSHKTRLNSSEIVSPTSLIEFFKTVFKGERVNPDHVTIGLVGYPNVGKTSTINSLLEKKRISVSDTPKRFFQTLYIEDDLLLRFCPGLVFPSFAYSKTELILNGILPIDQMKDYVPPINLICQIIPRHILALTYDILLRPSLTNKNSNGNCSTCDDLLDSLARTYGFMTAKGQPDNLRSARLILKDFVKGKFLYTHSPPDSDRNDYPFWAKRPKPVGPILEPEYREVEDSQVNSDEDADGYDTSLNYERIRFGEW